MGGLETWLGHFVKKNVLSAIYSQTTAGVVFLPFYIMICLVYSGNTFQSCLHF